MPDDDVEQVLQGGLANEGAVVRIGDTVRRPWRRSTPYAHAILTHLADVAPGIAPTPMGRDAQGREVLSWIDGDVAVPPFPAWAIDDAFLDSVGRLLRRVHEALAGWLPDPSLQFGTELADPEGGPQVVHTDVCPENVICRDGVAVALIDWDFASPGRPLWDVVSTARLCVPFVEPGRRNHEYEGVDVMARLRVLADAYGLSAAERASFGDVLRQRRNVSERFVRAQVAAGHPGFVAKWSDPTADERHLREQQWVQAVQPDLPTALGLG